MVAYTRDIPLDSDNPSTDQPNMKQNTNGIDDILAVDHVSFNLANGGQHLQVTFQGNNLPSTPTSPPVLFVNNQDGSGNALPGSLSELFYYSGSAAASKDQYFLGANGGSSLLMMGMIIKWGLVTAADNVTINFATASGAAFPNNCFGINVTAYANTTPSTIVTISPTPTASLFTPRVRQATGGAAANCTIFYIAFGN